MDLSEPNLGLGLGPRSMGGLMCQLCCNLPRGLRGGRRLGMSVRHKVCKGLGGL